MKFRRAVFIGPRLSPSTKVMLLRLADEMDAKAIVSVPRTRLAEELGVAPARISECIKSARALGYLSIVRRARPNVTAVYQGLIPSARGTESVPHSEVRPPVPQTGTDSVPQINGSEVRHDPTQVVVPAATSGTDPSTRPLQRGSDEKEATG